MSLATKPEIEQAHRLAEAHNQGKESPNVYVISVGKKRRMHTLWTYNKFSIRANPFQYIQNIDDNILDAVKKLIERFPDNEIEIDQDETVERAAQFEWKNLKFGKYKGQNIDVLIETDPSYCYWLYKKALEKSADPKQKRYFSKLDAYLIKPEQSDKIISNLNKKKVS